MSDAHLGQRESSREKLLIRTPLKEGFQLVRGLTEAADVACSRIGIATSALVIGVEPELSERAQLGCRHSSLRGWSELAGILHADTGVTSSSWIYCCGARTMPAPTACNVEEVCNADLVADASSSAEN